jgi:hypothetical protein
MALISQTGGLKAPAQTSAPQNTAVGSGSRPTPSRIKIKSSAPENAHSQGRDVPGSLR